jgi:hypothetical protein
MECVKVSVGTQQRVLHQIRSASLCHQVGIEAACGDQQQVVTARLERAAQELKIAGACLVELK